MNQLVALGVENKPINALGAFREGAATAAGLDQAKKEAAQQAMGMIGSIALGAMGGDMNGQADPQLYEEGLNILQGYGVDVTPFRGKPQLAPVAARASLTTMQQLANAQDEQSMNLALEKFERDIMESDRAYGIQTQTLDLQRERLNQPPDAPSGYRYGAEGGLEPIPGGPADPNNPMNTKRISGPSLSVTAQKEIFEADETVQSGQSVISALDRAMELNEEAYSGPLAEQRGYAGSLVGADAAVATEELKNLVTAQALDQLKTTFGAMPTEGERKILLEIQGSVNQAPEVRKRIYERAKAAAERRIEFARDKASRLRSGEYFTESPGGVAPTLEQPTAEEAMPATGGEITSQEQYDALPSGSEFMSNGKRYRKP